MSRERAQTILTSHFGPFGPIAFPYHVMGKIDSLHLFGLDTEMPIFALYWHNRERWMNALDIGANLGLHSILMAKLGWCVHAYEPDFAHYELLVENLEANGSVTVMPFMAAVHTENGEANFIRVLNNLTGNHLEGYKGSYGPRETVIVPTVDCRKLFDWADFAKIDCEGNEADLLLTTTAEQWTHLSVIAEVRNEANALQIYEHLRHLEVPIWSQRSDWEQVQTFGQMPTHNRHGSIFVGHQGPWDG